MGKDNKIKKHDHKPLREIKGASAKKGMKREKKKVRIPRERKEEKNRGTW